MKVLAFTVTRANTPQRATLLQNTITQGRRTAGMEFDWLVYCSGCSDSGKAVISAAVETGAAECAFDGPNVGQHVVWNMAVAEAKERGCDYLLRLDDDCEFLTKRWLKKLVNASVMLDDHMILGPTVKGLKAPPQCSSPCEVKGLELEFLIYGMGGICRLHPMSLLDRGYTADVRKPLGSGDATGLAKWCRNEVIPMAYVKSVRVKHAKGTAGQQRTDPIYHSQHELFQCLPYIPEFRG